MPIREQISKKGCIHATEFYSAAKRNRRRYRQPPGVISNHYAKWIKLDMRECIVYYFIYVEISRKDKKTWKLKDLELTVAGSGSRGSLQMLRRKCFRWWKVNWLWWWLPNWNWKTTELTYLQRWSMLCKLHFNKAVKKKHPANNGYVVKSAL